MGGDVASAAAEGAELAGALARARHDLALLRRVLGDHPPSLEPGDDALRRVAHLARDEPEWAEELRQAMDLSPAMRARAGTALHVTQFAGAWLLVPALDELRLDEVFGDAADPRHEAALARHLTLVKCLGASVASLAWRDPVVALASGLREPPPLEVLRDATRVALWNEPRRRTRLLANAREMLAAAGIPARRIGAGEASHLSLARMLDARVDRMLTVVAHAVMRRFARTLAGFTEGGAAYLARSFLLGSGTLEVGPDEWRAELPRSPLAIVLRMAGAHRRVISPPWYSGCRILLTLPPE